MNIKPSKNLLNIYQSFAGILCVAIAGCIAMPGGAMLGVDVVARYANIDFTWTPESPVGQLTRHGTPMELMADFMSVNGLVTGYVISGTSSASRYAAFKLPEALDVEPVGPICLYIRANRDARPIPVRMAGKPEGTAGFRYPEWEKTLALPSRKLALSKELTALNVRLGAMQSQLKQQSVVRHEAECESLTYKTGISKPRNVVEKPLHAIVARKICLYRAANISADHNKFDTFLSSIVQIAANMSETRARQAQSLLDEWNRLKAEIGPDYVPQIDGELPINSTVTKATKESENIKFVAGFLDAYQGCREDIPRQLANELASWQRAEANNPQRLANINEYSRNECRKAFAQAAGVRDSISNLAKHKATLEAEIRSLPQESPRLPARIQLQDNACKRG